MKPELPHLPITSAIPALKAALSSHSCATLTAPPGSGKTTIAPIALMDETWLQGRRILMLEPRRMAARAAAWRMSDLVGEQSGRTIGHHIRLERNFSRDTRIVVLTEGILARMLLSDPEAQDVGLLIFDEFHERSVHADFGLALALDIQRSLRPDLRILVMSATLDAAPISRHLGQGTPVVNADGSLYPVETFFVPRPQQARIAEFTAATVTRALREQTGSILAFLPGEGEIRAAAEMLERIRETSTDIMPLYAALPRAAQDAALLPSPPGRRKVVLATSIAESSLTIEGISTVVDSGAARVSRFSHGTGMSRLETIRIPRDRADQRRGRAGRLGPGFCYRTWSEQDDLALQPSSLPEILTADLADLVLQCADWGSSREDCLPWLTPPPSNTWRQAAGLLRSLGALDREGRITAHGRMMTRLGTHPRLAHAMLTSAANCDAETIAATCTLAAAIAEAGNGGFRVSTNAEILLAAAEGGNSAMPTATHKRIRELSESWRNSLKSTGVKSHNASPASVGAMISWAYPDRIGFRRKQADDDGRYLLSGGRGAKLPQGDPLAANDWIAIAEIDDKDADATVRLAAPLTEQEVERYHPDLFSRREILEWNGRAKRVDAVEREFFGEIPVRDRPLAEPQPDAVLKCLCDGIRGEGIARLNWTPAARNLQARITTVRSAMPEEGLPDVSDDALAAYLEQWLGAFLYGMTTLAQASGVDLVQPMMALIGAAARRLDSLAPTHLAVPSGSNIRIDYTGDQPAASVRIQEVFGMMKTPCIAGGRIPILLKLLSPAQRPVQITADLESFWKNGYSEVRKDLRGRYPKHYWPEDPMQATPTRRLAPRPN